MGSSNSRMKSTPIERPRRRQRRRSSIKRIVSSIIICGSSPSSSSSAGMGDNPAELPVNSAELADQHKLNPTSENNEMSVGSSTDANRIRTENLVSSERSIDANPSRVVQTNNAWRKFLSENREIIPLCQSIASVRGTETASTSSANQPSPTEISVLNAGNDINSSITRGSYQIDEAMCNSSIYRLRGPGVSTETNLAECGSASLVSDSLTEFDLVRNNSATQVERPTSSRFVAFESEENMDHGDLMDVSSDSPSSHGTSSRGMRRDNRRLFWDAVSRRNPRRDSDSWSSSFSSHNTDGIRSNNRLLLDSRGDCFSNEVQGNMHSSGSRIESDNDLHLSSRSEILERNRDSGDSVDPQPGTCPRGIHVDGLCTCRPDLSSEEYAPRAGMSRVVLLAEALFEVLDQIYRQPLLSMSMAASIPAPESVVDSFPVKIYLKQEISECANDVPQCYICLDEYEEGDTVRILPCHHEYHASCVDKWLKEVHGVCPLCRGDVREGHTEMEASVFNQETISH